MQVNRYTKSLESSMMPKLNVYSVMSRNRTDVPKWVEITDRCIGIIQFLLFQFDKTETDLTWSRKQHVLKNTDQEDGHPEPYQENHFHKEREIEVPHGKKSSDSDYYLLVDNSSTGFEGSVYTTTVHLKLSDGDDWWLFYQSYRGPGAFQHQLTYTTCFVEI